MSGKFLCAVIAMLHCALGTAAFVSQSARAESQAVATNFHPRADDEEDSESDEEEDNPIGRLQSAVDGIATKDQAPHWGLSGNVTLASDYILRGFSQTDHQPAIHGGFDRLTDDGIYFGVWGSNVHFIDSNTTMELDFSAGYIKRISDTLSITAGLSRVTYHESEGRDSWNIPVSAKWKSWSLDISYSPNWNEQGASIYYLLGWTQKLGWRIRTAIQLGYLEMFNAEEPDDQPDLTVSLMRPILDVNCGISGIVTKNREINGEVADSRVVFSLSQDF